MYKSTWKLLSIKIFALNRFLFVIANTWISKLLHDAGFTWRPRAVMAVKKVTYFRVDRLCPVKSLLPFKPTGGVKIEWTAEQLLHWKKYCFLVPREKNSSFCSSTPWLLVSGRHVGAHPDGHQLDASIQISIYLSKNFLLISCLWKTAVTWILVRVFGCLPSFLSQIVDFIY